MAETTRTIVTRIQNKYDPAAEWTFNNPILLVGEIGFESDTGKFKIGDGEKNWTELPYAAATPAEVDAIQLLDTSVKLEKELKTYYNVGKITNASGTNPVVIGNAGDSLRTVFNNLFNMDEVQPSITSNPSVSCSLSSSASDEYGTKIDSVSYSVSFNDGSYTNSSITGATMTGYSFSEGSSSSNTATSGTLTLPETYIVGESATFNTDITADYTQGNIAKTNLGNYSDPVIRIEAGSTDYTATFSKTSRYYPYALSSTSENLVSVYSGAKKALSTSTSTAFSLTLSDASYVWILLPPGNSGSKTIQYEALGQWYSFDGGTTGPLDVSLKLESGATVTYKGYRTNKKAATGTTSFKIV